MNNAIKRLSVQDLEFYDLELMQVLKLEMNEILA